MTGSWKCSINGWSVCDPDPVLFLYMNRSSYPLFSRFGVEIEYMVVDRERLDVSPTTDEILFHFGNGPTSEVEFDQATWSNELVRHVLEFKINQPAVQLESCVDIFQEQVRKANLWLAGEGRLLLPTGMHPWMNPKRETHLWPFEGSEIYQAFDRVFGCQGHGWSNLQSVHLNLPYSSEEEFVHLHAAIRLLLPLIPALSASTPFQEGQHLGFMDQRLESYRTNARRFDCVSGQVIPEPFDSYQAYREGVFDPIENCLKPLDPDGIFEAEWVNARGAIARLSRGSIEIRIIDTQECPLADLAILFLVVEALKVLLARHSGSPTAMLSYPQECLVDLFKQSSRDADRTILKDPVYLDLVGIDANESCMAVDFWNQVYRTKVSASSIFFEPLGIILNQGTLARRMLDTVGSRPSHEELQLLYRSLGHCLHDGVLLARDAPVG